MKWHIWRITVYNYHWKKSPAIKHHNWFLHSSHCSVLITLKFVTIFIRKWRESRAPTHTRVHLNLGRLIVFLSFTRKYWLRLHMSILTLKPINKTQYRYCWFLFLLLIALLNVNACVHFGDMEQHLTVVAALNDSVTCKTTSWCWIGGLGSSISPIQLFPLYVYWNKWGHGLGGKS